jgi:predicted GTPase
MAWHGMAGREFDNAGGPLCRRAEVVALVLDATECADAEAGRFTVTQQDFRLAELVAAEGRACVIVVNKWDTVTNKDSNTHVQFQKEVLAQLRALSWATVLFTSATTGERGHHGIFSCSKCDIFTSSAWVCILQLASCSLMMA